MTTLGPLTIYTAKRIVTMEPAMPTATAVAVAQGRVVSVGTLDSLVPWIDAHGSTVDRSLEDSVLMPGLIDPHVHPTLPATLTQFPFLAPDDWKLPNGTWPGARTPDDYIRRLREIIGNHTRADEPCMVWGYHQIWHGRISRDVLDQLAPDQPVAIWHRSFHEMFMNTAMLRWMNIADDEPPRHGVDGANGHFFEVGAFRAMAKLAPFVREPTRFAAGLATFFKMVHEGGVTTVLDMGVGNAGDIDAEVDQIRAAHSAADAPCRVILTPFAGAFMAKNVSPEDAVAAADALTSGNTADVFFDRHIKFMIDGAFFSGLFQLGFPGYLDGHLGEWTSPPEVTRRYAPAFWSAGYQLHAHTNGDLGVDFFIDLLRELLDARPRFDHRMTIEHFGNSTEDQVRQLAALGALVSAQPYYVHLLGDAYRTKWLGHERAEQMVRLGAVERHRIPLGLHSDCPMAPLEPLRLAWAASTRETVDGNVLGPLECLSLDAALRAITIDAAWILRREGEIGSIRAGKRADFTILDADPYHVGAQGLKDLTVRGTVFGGRVERFR
jgi:predicted amidohydrolase YtcJ